MREILQDTKDMLWALIALGEPILHGFSNIIDTHFSNITFKKTTTLIFFTGLTNVIFLPIVIFLGHPAIITREQIPFFLILGATGIGYLFPYYKALQNNDTSIIVSLFSLGKLFVPLLAFLLVGEVLSLHQYIGFFIIVLCGILLSMHKTNKTKLNSGFYWMLLCTIILAIESVIYKYVFTTMSRGTGFTWSTLFAFGYAMFLFLIPSIRKDILTNIHTFRKNFHIFALEEFLTFSGEGARTLAISLASVTLVSAISSLQSMFVLLFIVILSKFFPKTFKENISRESIIRKSILFAIMIGGIILTLI